MISHPLAHPQPQMTLTMLTQKFQVVLLIPTQTLLQNDQHSHASWWSKAEAYRVVVKRNNVKDLLGHSSWPFRQHPFQGKCVWALSDSMWIPTSHPLANASSARSLATIPGSVEPRRMYVKHALFLVTARKHALILMNPNAQTMEVHTQAQARSVWGLRFVAALLIQAEKQCSLVKARKQVEQAPPDSDTWRDSYAWAANANPNTRNQLAQLQDTIRLYSVKMKARVKSSRCCKPRTNHSKIKSQKWVPALPNCITWSKH